AGLPERLGGAVERAAVEVEAADHGAYGAVLRRHRHQRGLQGRHVDDFPSVALTADIDDRAAADLPVGVGLGVERPGNDRQGLLVGNRDDLGGAARDGDFGGAGRQHHAGQEVAAVGGVFLYAVEDFFECLAVLFDAVGQVDLVFGARVGRAPGVVQHAGTHRFVGSLLGFRVDGGVDIQAQRVSFILE